MNKILFCWIGETDLKASERDNKVAPGPIACALESYDFDFLVLISSWPKKRDDAYKKWLSRLSKTKITIHKANLTSPTHYGDIYENVVKTVKKYKKESGAYEFFFHLSPGTPAMSAVWIFVSQAQYPAKLVETSAKPNKSFQFTSIPFSISAEYLPDAIKEKDKDLIRLSQGLAPEAPEFDSIIHRSKIMQHLITQAKTVAPRDVPVLILGDSGTGKELFANAIHRSSPRRNGSFKPVNCGAISTELVESELFGHEKGAFTGASARKIGYIEAASGGTLFLDEIGDLPLAAQVKLLRVLEKQELNRVGSSKPIKIDIRVISATHKPLLQEVAQGNFREDLFYRLAVAILKIPPLREREGDLGILISHLLEEINKKAVSQPGYKGKKKLSPAAKNLLLQHPWPGNIRELHNTLQRAVIWSAGETIDEEDIKESILEIPGSQNSNILDRSLSNGINLESLLGEVAKHYLERAIKESGGNKTSAAKMLGLSNYQTFTNWMQRYKTI
jgi:transcriptional regulator with PAS, ATPase and Fis domain